MICRFCESEFHPKPGKPGRIDVCYLVECQKQDRKQAPEPAMRLATVAWSGKHSPEIIVDHENSPHSRKMVQIFNQSQRRNGAYPLAGFGAGAASIREID